MNRDRKHRAIIYIASSLDSMRSGPPDASGSSAGLGTIPSILFEIGIIMPKKSSITLVDMNQRPNKHYGSQLKPIATGVLLFVTVLITHAQQTSGSISGRAGVGSTVSIENKSIGITRTVIVGSDGGFQASQLPPGDYTVTFKRASGTSIAETVSVGAGQGAVVNGSTDQQVVVTGQNFRRLDVKSTESTTSLSKSELDRIPVLRDTTAITLLAPGATAGDGRIGQTTTRGGNVASLGGASPAENSYYINGFNVTNIVNGVAFNSIPYEGVGFQEVKTGGYGAEFGRSLGGVISVNTKRGTDEFRGGANISFEPSNMRGSSVYALKDTSGKWNLINRPGESSNTTYNVWAGGPIVKDSLYGFALVSRSKESITIFGNAQQSSLNNDSPKYLVKLDWNINKNNLLELTAFSDKSTDTLESWKQVTAYETPKGAGLGKDKYNTGGQNTIVKWTGLLTNDLTLSALAGRGEYSRSSAIESAGCAYVQDRRVSPRVQYGCATATSITDPKANDKRDAFRIDAEWALGRHTLKLGLDREIYTTADGTVYPGAANTAYLLRRVGAGGTIANGYSNTSGAAIDYVEARTFSNGGKFKTENSAWYVEDAFQVTPNVLLNLGVRSESFTNKNADDVAFIKVSNTIAPRIGVTWDVTGKADLKLYGNAGRYYIPVYANTNVRLAGKQLDYSDYFVYSGALSADRFQIPGLGAQLGSRKVNSDGSAPDPRTIVDPNIKPLFQDEFILGFQRALADGWTYGLKYTHRELKSAMDDICAGGNAKAWALANGYTASQATAIGNTVDHCFLANPGKPLTANVDLNGTGVLTPVTIPADGLGFPEKPKREL